MGKMIDSIPFVAKLRQRLNDFESRLASLTFSLADGVAALSCQIKELGNLIRGAAEAAGNDVRDQLQADADARQAKLLDRLETLESASVARADVCQRELLKKADVGQVRADVRQKELLDRLNALEAAAVTRADARQRELLEKADAGRSGADVRQTELLERLNALEKTFSSRADFRQVELLKRADAGQAGADVRQTELLERLNALETTFVSRADFRQVELLEKADAGQAGADVRQAELLERLNALEKTVVSRADFRQVELLEKADAGQAGADVRQAELLERLNALESTTVVQADVRQRELLEKADTGQVAADHRQTELLGEISAFRKAQQDIFDQLHTMGEDAKKVILQDNIRCRWQVVDVLDNVLYPPSTSVKCPVCGRQEQRQSLQTRVSECIFGGGRLERFICPECGCTFGPLKMMTLSPAQLSAEYEQHYRVYCEGDSKWKEQEAFKALFPKKELCYLNYGAGAWSKTTIALREAGWNVYDYEPYAPCDERTWVIRSLEELKRFKFDGIFSNDVLEHFRDPVVALKEMRSLLKPGGAMAHCTGCYEYAYEYTRFHFAFFTGRSLDVLARRAGLRAELRPKLKPDDSARICIFERD